MTSSRECFENKWFYMKYIGKYFWPVSVLLLLPGYESDSVVTECV